MALHVLHVVPSLAPQADSVGVALPGLLRALTDADCRGAVLVLDNHADVEPAFNVQAWSVHAWDPNKSLRLIDDADVVHLHGLGDRRSTVVARAAHRRSTPVVLAPHGALSPAGSTRRSLRQRLVGGFRDRAILRSVGAVQALHAVEARHLKPHRLGGPLVQLPYSADVTESSQTNGVAPVVEGVDGPCLLMLGPIDPVEGVLAVLKSIAELGTSGNDWRVVLAGPTQGAWRAMLEAGIRRKGAEDRVLFTSAPDLPSQRTWLERASLLVAGGLRIRPAVSIMQGVAMGVPVLSTSCVVPDDLTDCVTVCEPTRAEIRAGLRETLDMGEDARRSQAAKAKACFQSRLSWEILAPRYLELYQRVKANK